MENNLTTGSVFGNLALFALPYLLSYFLQTLYGMADLFIIGQFERRGRHHGRFRRLPGDAHAHGDDRGPGHGRYREHRPGGGC